MIPVAKAASESKIRQNDNVRLSAVILTANSWSTANFGGGHTPTDHLESALAAAEQSCQKTFLARRTSCANAGPILLARAERNAKPGRHWLLPWISGSCVNFPPIAIPHPHPGSKETS